MIKRQQKDGFPGFVALGLFMFAGLLHICENIFTNVTSVFFVVSGSIYFALLVCWAIYIRRCILSEKIKNLLTTLALLLLFYIFIRSCKYRFTAYDEVFTRHLWYMFYIPQLFAPVIAFAVAVRVGMSESYKLPVTVKALFAAAGILSVLFMTNDIHELAFAFNENFADWDTQYIYGPLFYISVGWTFLWLFSSVVLLTYKSKVLDIRSAWMPVVWIIIVIAYVLIVKFTKVFDQIRPFNLPEAECFAMVAVLESCIRVNLIPSNRGYRRFFKKSSLSVRITDEAYNTVYSSEFAAYASKQQMECAEREPVFLDKDTILHSKKVYGGHFVWTEDISSVNKINDELFETGEKLYEKSELLRAEADIKEQRAKVDEQNRLYDHIAEHLKPQFERISGLIENEDMFKENARLICVLNCYVKRRSNLTLIADSSDRLDINELFLSIKESAEYIKLYGIPDSVYLEGEGSLPSEQVLLSYDIWEAVAESLIPHADAFMTNIYIDENSFIMKLSADNTGKDFCCDPFIERIAAAKGHIKTMTEDDTLFIIFSIGKDGAEI